ncbi:oligosaccharide flippase family protein [Vibrio sp. nBUS_14]|uniref:oligosaccharide flippase family protein n=1 Tax=Vibrio sp. nBUS_14 TaxID=3395321 RepID=UPI003EB8DD99
MNIKKAAIFSFGPLVAALVGFITTPVLSWLFSAESIGVYSLSMSVISFSIIVMCLGMDSSYIREFHETKNKLVLFSSCLIPSAFISIIFITFLFFVNTLNVSVFTLVEVKYLLVISIIAMANRFLSLRFRMQERAEVYSGYLILNKALTLVFILIYFKSGVLERSSIFYAFLSTHISLFIYLLLLSKEKFKLSTPDVSLLPSLLNYGIPLVVSSVSYWAMASSDKFIISYYLGMESVGFYSVAQTLGAVFIIFQSILSVIWPPYIYKLNKKSPIIAIKKASDWLDIIMSISIFICIVFVSFSDVIVGVFPEEYSDIRNIISVIFLSSVIYTISELMLIGMNVSKKTSYVMFITIISLIVNLVLSIYLVKDFQLYGVAISTLISFSVMLFLRALGSHYFWGGEKKRSIFCKLLILYFVVLFHKYIPSYMLLFLGVGLIVVEYKKMRDVFNYVKLNKS